jgi:hypothetical protein
MDFQRALYLIGMSSFALYGQKPVAKFTFNQGKVQDEVSGFAGKAEDAILTEDRFGNPKHAFFLHGTYSSYINLGTSDKLKPLHGAISLWVSIDKPIYKGKGIETNPIILTKSHGGDDFFEGYCIGYDYYLKKLTISISAVKAGDTNQVSMSSSELFSLMKWHHLVLAYNDQHFWLYVDGELQNGNKPMAKNFRSQFLQGDSVMIGNTANQKNSRYLCGSVDDIYFFDKVPTAAEVQTLFHEGDPDLTKRYLKWLYWGLAFTGFTGLGVWTFTYRYKKDLKNQKERNRIQARLLELETRAIRSQMNPHFIFNSLNSLQRFILEGNIHASNEYLTRFSKLLRKLIESSDSDQISLEEEMEILRNYIEIERMRFDNSFEFNMHSSIGDPASVYLPFMLVQPFVENAIWHGLLPQKEKRMLKIEFSEFDSKRIKCIVEDSGVGLNVSASKDKGLKKRSVGIEFIRQRLDLLAKITGVECGVTLTDKQNNDETGTVVSILIPKMSPT